MDIVLAQLEGNVADLGKAIAFGVGVGLGAVGAGIGIGTIFGSMIQAVARQPELRGELTGIQWLGFALTEAVVFYALLGGLLAFVLVMYVLRRLAFGRIQGLIDQRRERIRDALDAADKAREEARELRELTRREREEAKAERDRLLEDGRRQAQAQLEQSRREADEDLKRRLEENRKEIEAENRRLREQIRRDVVELTLLTAEKVTGRVLDDKEQRRLIEETVQEVDVKELVSGNGEG